MFDVWAVALALVFAQAEEPAGARSSGPAVLDMLQERFGPAPGGLGADGSMSTAECAQSQAYASMRSRARAQVVDTVSQASSKTGAFDEWVLLAELDRGLSNQFGPLWMAAMATDEPECAQEGLQEVFGLSLVFLRRHASEKLVTLMGEPDFFDRLDDQALRRAFFYTVQHADHDPDFQTRVLGELVLLDPDHSLSSAHIPSLTDRLLAAREGRQRYGTIFTCEGGQGGLAYPLEDEDGAESARSRFGLPPLEDHFEATCAAMASGEEVVVRRGP